MKAILMLAALATSAAAVASAAQTGGVVYSGRKPLGEAWVYPIMFQQTLSPLAPLARDVVKGGQCPGLAVGADQVLHNYDFDAKMKTRGTGENKRWVVDELKLVNPSACPALDTQVTAMMRTAIPTFAEPYKDLDGNGWTRIPRVQIKLTD
jgi:opacity protein-like surface antigen